ncbi:MAG: hypothetical protein Q7K39_03365 [Candidatus Magasanikbacteria bacterium]|nr:hypothetical protein [Candidatus Magasanikbacteria bacterium]
MAGERDDVYPFPQTAEFEMAKRKFFSDFALAHLSQFRIHQSGGILGKENRDWRNISEHCLVEAVAADTIAAATGANREILVAAALLHDWFKRREIERTCATNPAQMGASLADIEKADRVALEKFGVAPVVIDLAHANILAAGDAEYLGSRTLEEKIMHWIDLSTQDTLVVDFRERVQAAEQKDAYRAWSESLRPQYGGKSLSEIDIAVAAQEQAEIERLLNIPDGALVTWIRSQIENKIANKLKK